MKRERELAGSVELWVVYVSLAFIVCVWGFVAASKIDDVTDQLDRIEATTTTVQAGVE